MVRGVARLSLAVALALLICAAQLVAAGRQQQPHSRSRPRTQSSMSSLQRRAVRLLQLTPPAPVDLGGAKKLHAELLQRLSTIRYVYGHAPSARPELAHLAAVRAPTTTALGEVEPACVAAFQSACGGVGSDRICDVCAGQNQHALRAAGCAPADVLLMCSGEDGPLITPVAFGADPTGATDSTAAFRSAVSAMLQRADGQLAAPIRDLGGVTLDLLGGKYTTDNPVAFPANVGNFAVTHRRAPLQRHRHLHPAGLYSKSAPSPARRLRRRASATNTSICTTCFWTAVTLLAVASTCTTLWASRLARTHLSLGLWTPASESTEVTRQ